MLILLSLLLCGFAFAADDNADSSTDQSDAVAKFQQWLQQRNDSDQAKLQTSNPVTTDASSGGSTTDPVAQAAFQQVTQNTMPMSPDQIKQYKGMVQETQRAAATYPGGPPKPVSSTLIVNMAPGAVPPAIKMYQGFITSLVFVDSSGAVWPVANYDLGNSKAFNVQWDKKSNVLMIQPLEGYTFANLAVRLEGLPTPVMLTLVPGQKTVDYRVDLRVNGLGPNAKNSSVGGSVPSQADSTLLAVLDGIPPSGSTQLSIEGEAGQAWLTGDEMFIRTRFTLLSPGWINMMTSPDGMHAYKVQKTPSILLSEYGKPVSVKIKGV